MQSCTERPERCFPDGCMGTRILEGPGADWDDDGWDNVDWDNVECASTAREVKITTFPQNNGQWLETIVADRVDAHNTDNLPIPNGYPMFTSIADIPTLVELTGNNLHFKHLARRIFIVSSDNPQNLSDICDKIVLNVGTAATSIYKPTVVLDNIRITYPKDIGALHTMMKQHWIVICIEGYSIWRGSTHLPKGKVEGRCYIRGVNTDDKKMIKWCHKHAMRKMEFYAYNDIIEKADLPKFKLT